MGNKVSSISTLKDPSNTEKILNMTADTMFLIRNDGICEDLVVHTDRWFLQKPEKIIGKNLFELMPSETSIALYNNIQKVLSTGATCTDNYEMQLNKTCFFFKCIIHRFDDQHLLLQYRDITQRILLKQKLEAANLRLMEIEKGAGIGHWHFNINQSVIHYEGFFDLTHNSTGPNTLPINTFLEHIHPADRKPLIHFFKNIPTQSGKLDWTFRFQQDDRLHFYRIKSIRSYTEDNETFVEGFIQNVTDIHIKQQQLEMVTQAVSNASDYIFAMDNQGHLVFGNRMFCSLNGLDPEQDFSSINLFETTQKWQNAHRWKDIVQQVSENKQQLRFIIHKNPVDQPEKIHSFDCNAYSISDSLDRNIVWVFGKDISERLAYEQQVKELNQIMSTVLNTIPMFISVKDIRDQSRYIFTNRSDESQNAFFSDPIIGKTDTDIYPEDIASEIKKEDRLLAEGEGEMRRFIEETDVQGDVRYKDQLRILIRDEVRPLIVTIEQDITKTKQLELELIDAKLKAEQSDRLKSAFIANMSHEIRTPLNAIVGFSRIIAETESIEERRSYHSIVEANSERLLGLINEILDLSKIESGIMEFENNPLKLRDFGEDMLNTMRLKCPKGVDLIFDAPNKDLVILCDKNRLSQILINLIGNAFKFTSIGSIRFGYKQVENGLSFFVQDTGKGIPADKVDRVFDRFVKADRYTQGTGLGLSISRSIVERMGGHIEVQSELNKGTLFTFFLPAHYLIAEHRLTNEHTSASDMPDTHDVQVLVAEDTDSNYKLIEAMIGRHCILFRAHNGLEAIEMTDKIQPTIVLMDIKMPEMNGLDAAKILREKYPNLPIIAQSAFAFDDDKKKAIEHGCTDFIAKPFTKKQLMEVIQKHVR